MQQEVDVNPFFALGPGLVTYEWKTQILSIHLSFAESGLEPVVAPTVVGTFTRGSKNVGRRLLKTLVRTN